MNNNELSDLEKRFSKSHKTNITEAIAIFDENHNCLHTNCFFNNIFHYNHNEINNLHELDLIAPSSREFVSKKIEEKLCEHYETLLLQKNGGKFWGIIHTFFFNNKDQVLKIISYRNITNEKHIQEKLLNINEEFETIFENSQVGILLLSGTRIIQKINNKFAEIFNYSDPDTLIGKNIKMLHLSEESYNKFGKYYKTSLLERKQIKLEYQFKDADGKPIWVEVSGCIIDKEDPPSLDKGVVWVFENIEKRKKAEERLIELTYTDELTKIGNRRYFKEQANIQLEIHKRYKRSCAFLMIDIDYFKKINDSYGHDTGDKALQYFTQICKTKIRHTDIFSRLGGDEFGIFLLEADLETAIIIAEKIQSKLAASTPMAEKTIPEISISIGISMLEDRQETLNDIIKRADKALYIAKENGRNQTQYHLKYDCS